jgi:hypothetical protein
MMKAKQGGKDPVGMQSMWADYTHDMGRGLVITAEEPKYVIEHYSE